jgi:hypothetical protein
MRIQVTPQKPFQVIFALRNVLNNFGHAWKFIDYLYVKIHALFLGFLRRHRVLRGHWPDYLFDIVDNVSLHLEDVFM